MASGEERAKRLSRADWASGEESWRGRFEGAALSGANVSVIFFASEAVGAGPKLHVHPYDEVFIVREGRAKIRIGARTFEAVRGDVVLAPAHVPHAFANLGPGRLETTDIHLSAKIIQTDLDDPHAPNADT